MCLPKVTEVPDAIVQMLPERMVAQNFGVEPGTIFKSVRRVETPSPGSIISRVRVLPLFYRFYFCI